MKITKADISQAIANTPKSLDHANIRAMRSAFLGFWTPRDANWSWELHAICHEGNPLVVAARFGYIVAEG
jgi:hypothetical protein